MKYSRLFAAALGASLAASAARAQSRLSPTIAVDAAHVAVAPAVAPTSLSLAPSLSAAPGVVVANAPAALVAPAAAPAAASAETAQAPLASKSALTAAPAAQTTAKASQAAERVLPEAAQLGAEIQTAASRGASGAALNAFYDHSSPRDSAEPVAVSRALAANDGPTLGAPSGRDRAASAETPAPAGLDRPVVRAGRYVFTLKNLLVTAAGALVFTQTGSVLLGMAAALGVLGLTLIGSGVAALSRAAVKANTLKSPEHYAPGYWGMLLRFGLLIHGAIMSVGGLLTVLSGGSALLLTMGLPVLTLSIVMAIPMFTRPQNPAPDFPGIGGPIALLSIGASLFSAINIAVMTVDPSQIATGPWILPGFFGMMALSFTATDWFKPNESDTSASARAWTRAIMGVGSIALIASMIFFGGSAAGVMIAYGVGTSLVILGGAYLSRIITGLQRIVARLLGGAPKEPAPKGPGVGEILRENLSRGQLVWGGLAVGAAFASAVFVLSLAGITAGWLQLAYLLPVAGATAGYLLSLPGKRA